MDDHTIVSYNRSTNHYHTPPTHTQNTHDKPHYDNDFLFTPRPMLLRIRTA